jgi:hypothetical protein
LENIEPTFNSIIEFTESTMITERSLAAMVKQALKAYNHQEYARLELDGSLESFAKLHAEAAMETRDELMHLAMDEAAHH